MNPFVKLGSLLRITGAHGIMRRYLVVNGFDGALTMLGLVFGFLVGGPVELSVAINACLGAAIALAVSGVSSAYISETAERRRALSELEKTMLTDLEASSHGEAVRWVPILIALTNGGAPLLVSLAIIAPLWLAHAGVTAPIEPLISAACVAFFIVFVLGAYLGRVVGVSWVRSGIQTLLVAGVTAGLIFIFVDA